MPADEVGRQADAVVLGLGDGRLEELQLPPEAAGLGAGLEQRTVGVRAAHVEERARSPAAATPIDRGDERERRFVGDDRDDPDRDREHGEHGAHATPR